MYERKPFLFTFAAEETPGGSEPVESDMPVDSDNSPSDEEDETAEDSDDGDEQEEWDRERALSKIRKTNAENKRLRERSKKAEEESKKLPDLEARNRELESRLLRMEVAAELGIPKSIADRLNGGTREEVLADAEELLALIGPAAPKQRKPINGFGESHSNEAAPVKPISLDELAAGFMRD